jgi:hypothetical protein
MTRIERIQYSGIYYEVGITYSTYYLGHLAYREVPEHLMKIFLDYDDEYPSGYKDFKLVEYFIKKYRSDIFSWLTGSEIEAAGLVEHTEKNACSIKLLFRTDSVEELLFRLSFKVKVEN